VASKKYIPRLLSSHSLRGIPDSDVESIDSNAYESIHILAIRPPAPKRPPEPVLAKEAAIMVPESLYPEEVVENLPAQTHAVSAYDPEPRSMTLQISDDDPKIQEM
jgi:hypothetical protein